MLQSMEQAVATGTDLLSIPTDLRIVSLIPQIEAEINQPMEGDPYLPAICRALDEALTDEINDEFRDIVSFGLELREALGAKNVSQRDYLKNCWAALQKQELRDYGDAYPTRDHKTIAPWRFRIREVVSDDAAREEFIYDLTRDIATNYAPRAASLELIIQSELERLGARPSILEVGAGDGQNLVILSTDVQESFDPIQVVSTKEKKPRGSDIHEAKKRLAGPTAMVNERLQDKVEKGLSVGVDPILDDQQGSEWVFACFRPGDIANRRTKERFRNLNQAKRGLVAAGNLVLHPTEFNPEGMQDLSYNLGVDKFSVIALYTCMYLFDEKGRKEVRELARAHTSGLIVYQDKVTVDSFNPSRTRFLTNFDGFRYRTLVEDPHDPTHRLREVFWHDSGRCRKLAFGPDLGYLALGRELKAA